MKIVVCVKQVPDTWSEKKLDPATKTLDRASVDGVMNELDEYAVEEALKIAEATSGEVTVLSMGPEQSTETIRKALSMGADAGIHVLDDALAGSDAVATSLAIATVLGDRGVDLIIFGSESTDARMSVVPAMVAERLGLPQLTFANKVEAPGDGTVKIHRLTDYGYDVVEAVAAQPWAAAVKRRPRRLNAARTVCVPPEPALAGSPVTAPRRCFHRRPTRSPPVAPSGCR